MPHSLDARSPDFEERFRNFLNLRAESGAAVDRTVAGILKEVHDRGDVAVLEYTEELDGHRLTPGGMRLPFEALQAAVERCDPDIIRAMQLAHSRIEAFHRRQVPKDLDYTDDQGIRLGHRWSAIDAVGLYVPGGTAPLFSSVLMNAVPAKVAGVRRLVMTSPAPGGEVNDLMLAAAYIAGVDEVYRIGGAQAVGALAYGTETIAPVDKIVGPGNAYVASAKRQVFGTVGIDMVAGPSEVLVVADRKNRPEVIAADLLAQSEHDAKAQAILMTDDAAFAEAVVRAVDTHLQRLPRSEIAARSWHDYGAVVLLARIEDAPPLVDRIAPEHLELAVAQPDALLGRVRHAGAIFLGSHTPEVVGDYVAGPNHVLPTERTARFASGLSVLDFMKRSSILSCPPSGLQAIGPAAVTLARAEGLDAHALSVALRLEGETDS